MTTRDILTKLTEQLEMGITSEVQVVYLLAGVRKLMERDAIGGLPNLKFHCDWALHSRMDRAGAKSILRQLDAVYLLLRNKVEFKMLPWELRSEIDRIFKMSYFERELSKFLDANELPQPTKHRSDGWSYFLNLYARVIEDIPLIVSLPNSEERPTNISHVTVHFEPGRDTLEYDGIEEALFRVTWRIHGKDGLAGDIDVINSFLI
jgi:hypothetical protein